MPNPFLAGFGSGLSELSRHLMNKYMIDQEEKRRQEALARDEARYRQDVAFRQGEVDFRNKRAALEDERFKLGEAKEALPLYNPGDVIDESTAKIIENTPWGRAFGTRRNQLQSQGQALGSLPGGLGMGPLPNFQVPQVEQKSVLTRRIMPQDIDVAQERGVRGLQAESLQQGISQAAKQFQRGEADYEAQERAIGNIGGIGNITNFRKINPGDALRIQGLLPALINALDNGAGRGDAARARMDALVQQTYDRVFDNYVNTAKAGMQYNKELIGAVDPTEREAAAQRFLEKIYAEANAKANEHVRRVFPDYGKFFPAPAPQAPPPPPEIAQLEATKKIWDDALISPQNPNSRSAQGVKRLVDQIASRLDMSPEHKVQSLELIKQRLGSYSMSQDFRPAAELHIDATISAIKNNEGGLNIQPGGVQFNLSPEKNNLAEAIAAFASGGRRPIRRQ